MATSTERSRETRKRRRRREWIVPVRVTESELKGIAQRGYAGAASADRRAWGEAISTYLSDTLYAALR